MLNTNEIDWNEVGSSISPSSSATGSETTSSGEKSVFLKLKAGFHHLRIVPSGNNLKKTFFLKLMQHPIKVPKDDGSGSLDQFVLCWSYVMNDLISMKDNPEAQKTKSFVSYLGQIKAITPDEFTKYQTYGCPMCKAFNRLNEMGVDNETKNKFYPKEQYFFNVIWRSQTFMGQPATGDDNVYIWRTSKTMGGGVVTNIDTMMKQGGINYVDINTGKDILLQATGEKLARRYPLCQFVDRGTPLNLGERISHNLLDVLQASNKEYQKVVNYMKVAYGELLKQYGHVIAGDQALTQAYGNSVEAVQMANQVIAQAQTPSQFAVPANIAQGGATVDEPKWLPGDEIIEINGMAHNKRTGKPLF